MSYGFNADDVNQYYNNNGDNKNNRPPPQYHFGFNVANTQTGAQVHFHIHRPSPAGPGVSPNGNWSTGLCDCLEECGLCCEVWCIPSLQVSLQYNLMKHHMRRKVDWLICILACCVPLAGDVLGCIIRSEARQRYRIRGNCCCDCMTVWCCQCCALVQQARQMTAMGESACGLCYNPTLEPLIM